MGAALRRKEAAKLGLSDCDGGRHLVPAVEGPAPHWRAFTAALDAVELNEDQEKRAKEGALEAFARVQALVDARRACRPGGAFPGRRSHPERMAAAGLAVRGSGICWLARSPAATEDRTPVPSGQEGAVRGDL